MKRERAQGQVLLSPGNRYWQVVKLDPDSRHVQIRLLTGNNQTRWHDYDAGKFYGWKLIAEPKIRGCGKCDCCAQGMVGSCHMPSQFVPPPRGDLQAAIKGMVTK